MEGMEEMLANIDRLKMNNQREARKAVDEAADIVMKNVQPLIPISSALPANYGKEHIVYELTKTGFVGGQGGEIKKKVGYKGKEAWRVHFPDSGTVKQAAQNFNDRGLEMSRDKVLSCYSSHARKGMKV